MSFSLVPGFAQRYPKDEEDGLSWRDSILIESCCTTLDEALAAQSRGADRIELCTDLSRGGFTPTRDLITEVVKTLTIPVNVLIRPSTRESSAGGNASQTRATLGTVRGRGQGFAWEGSSEARRFERHCQSASHVDGIEFSAWEFVYAKSDLDQMVADIEYCKTVGATGIVVGALTPDRVIDTAAMRRLIAAAAPLPVTFHRAFDVASGDPFDDLETLITLGCARLLTSGRAATAWDGRGLISRLVSHAAGRLIVMPGCGVNPTNLPVLHAFTHASEYHGTKLP